MSILNKIRMYKRRQFQRKYRLVRSEWLKFFETREKHLGGVHIPAFILANEQMAHIMINNELDSYYKRIMNYKKLMANKVA